MVYDFNEMVRGKEWPWIAFYLAHDQDGKKRSPEEYAEQLKYLIRIVRGQKQGAQDFRIDRILKSDVAHTKVGDLIISPPRLLAGAPRRGMRILKKLGRP